MFETDLDKEYGCCRVEGIAQYSEAYESRILEKGDLLWEVDGKSAAHKSLPELSCMIMVNVGIYAWLYTCSRP